MAFREGEECILPIIPRAREKELQNRTADGTFKIFIHHGPKKAKKATDFKGYDVVLTTYGTIGAEFPKLRNDTKGGAPLLGERGREEADAEYERDREELEDKAEVIRVQAGPVLSNAWHRVVLDEAHTIKNKRTKQAWACRWLNATFRWCLTWVFCRHGLFRHGC